MKLNTHCAALAVVAAVAITGTGIATAKSTPAATKQPQVKLPDPYQVADLEDLVTKGCRLKWSIPIPADYTKQEFLGKLLFDDVRLSEPPGQSCATCHSPGSGFNGNGDASVPVFEGAYAGRYGNRNPPSAAYASFSPKFGLSGTGYVGGQFWDGRAQDLIEQAKGPFLNPLEMNNEKPADVVRKVYTAAYFPLYIQVYGTKELRNVKKAYENIAAAIAAYEANSNTVNRFTSKFDAVRDGKTAFTDQEVKGYDLFKGKGLCFRCHPDTGAPYASKPLFTDFTYDNLGIPPNPELKVSAPDLGLGGIIQGGTEDGKFKVPTLRNVAVTPPYGHNGYFKSLKQIVHFYNTRDVLSWPAADVSRNVNKMELGNLNLTDAEEDAIVAFLETLTDGYLPFYMPPTPTTTALK